MAGSALTAEETLLVASRGASPTHGLYRWVDTAGRWTGTQLATVKQLSALALHPRLPVVYGTSGMGQEGSIHAWRLEGATATPLGEKLSEGAEPCHLTVDPTGRLLIVTNYTSSTLAIQNLGADGSFGGPIELIRLSGGGPEADRQDDAHPHQVLFRDGVLFVVDLGADLLREYGVDATKGGAAALTAGRVTAVPAGTGPRHAVGLQEGRFAISGELGSNLVVGRPGAPVGEWANVPSTLRTGPAKTRHARNYPGDIQRSLDGRFVYFANRGYDTISTFDVRSSVPVLVSELDSAVAWPQHLLPLADRLLIAGWDSSRVAAMPLQDGKPGPAEHVFDCSGAGWLTVFADV
ncbi:MAG: beta-propeller fold lactonase family protein [Devosia sp.]|nr:beta-propeller fold lactonase family protein [Devosia sp.]